MSELLNSESHKRRGFAHPTGGRRSGASATYALVKEGVRRPSNSFQYQNNKMRNNNRLKTHQVLYSPSGMDEHNKRMDYLHQSFLDSNSRNSYLQESIPPQPIIPDPTKSNFTKRLIEEHKERAYHLTNGQEFTHPVFYNIS